MTVPSKSWGVITDGQVDADSPLDTTLITAIRDNLLHLEEWLGDSYTAAKDHDHDGLNSKVLSAPTVQSDGSQLLTSSSTWTPSAGTYHITTDAAFTGYAVFKIYIDSAWRAHGSSWVEGGLVYCDGTNMKFENTSPSYSEKVWYQKFN